MEQVGTVLWSLRTSRGWTLGQLARQAGVSKAALSRWESGERQPRMPELLAVLDALDASPAQRSLALARMDVPRALRQLREASLENSAGAPPTAGDLLRALRLRRGWSQQEVAERAGAGRTAVVRWENGDRLPSAEQMQTLCFVLGASEEEWFALTTGRFSEPTDGASHWEERAAALLQRRERFSNGDIQTPGDLFYLNLQHEAWKLATEHEEATSVLAEILAYYAQELVNYQRWSEADTIALRALSLAPRQKHEPEYALRAALAHAAASVFAGHRVVPERGIHELQGVLPHSNSPVFTAWILSDTAKYTTLAGQAERGIALAAQALDVAEQSESHSDRLRRLIDYSLALMEAGRLDEALERLPGVLPDVGDVFVHEALARADAYGRLGSFSAAQDWLLRGYAAVPGANAEHLRPQLDALAAAYPPVAKPG